MNVTIYGLLGHAGHLKLPLEHLEIQEMEQGEEFIFNGKVYEIRSVTHMDPDIILNVSLVLNHSWG